MTRHHAQILLLASGEFARVFDLADGKVLEAHRLRPRGGNEPGDPVESDVRFARLLFEAEVGAYGIIATDSALAEVRHHSPRYYGTVDPSACALPGSEAIGLLVPGCGLLLVRLSGKEGNVLRLESDLRGKAEAVLERSELRVPHRTDEKRELRQPVAFTRRSGHRCRNSLELVFDHFVSQVHKLAHKKRPFLGHPLSDFEWYRCYWTIAKGTPETHCPPDTTGRAIATP